MTARVCKCDNCQWTGIESQLGKTLFQIHRLAERLDPGSVVPAGECPKCGSFAYLMGEQYHGDDCQ